MIPVSGRSASPSVSEDSFKDRCMDTLQQHMDAFERSGLETEKEQTKITMMQFLVQEVLQNDTKPLSEIVDVLRRAKDETDMRGFVPHSHDDNKSHFGTFMQNILQQAVSEKNRSPYPNLSRSAQPSAPPSEDTMSVSGGAVLVGGRPPFKPEGSPQLSMACPGRTIYKPEDGQASAWVVPPPSYEGGK